MRLNKIIYTILLLFIIGLSCNAQHSKKDIYFNYDKPLADIIKKLPDKPRSLNVLIVKSKYVLTLYHDTIKLKSYPIVLGFNPVDDKLKEGDGCTPEGRFKIISKYPHASWSKFIWINYPTTDSWTKHKKAKTAGKIPKDARIGGQIGIHGVPKGYDSAIDQQQNWTLGCISLKNKDVNEIYDYITKWSIIEIRNK